MEVGYVRVYSWSEKDYQYESTIDMRTHIWINYGNEESYGHFCMIRSIMVSMVHYLDNWWDDGRFIFRIKCCRCYVCPLFKGFNMWNMLDICMNYEKMNILMDICIWIKHEHERSWVELLDFIYSNIIGSSWEVDPVVHYDSIRAGSLTTQSIMFHDETWIYWFMILRV